MFDNYYLSIYYLFGYFPLGLPGFLATSQDNPDIMAYLVHNCPENTQALRIRDLQGETVLSLAEKRGHKKVVSWVRAKMTHQLSVSSLEPLFPSNEKMYLSVLKYNEGLLTDYGKEDVTVRVKLVVV